MSDTQTPYFIPKVRKGSAKGVKKMREDFDSALSRKAASAQQKVQVADIPPLPAPAKRKFSDPRCTDGYFTAEQMRDYARQALHKAAPAAPATVYYGGSKEPEPVSFDTLPCPHNCPNIGYCDGSCQCPEQDEREALSTEQREFLGKLVRAEWMRWAREQPDPKASWLQSWNELTEPEREVDRRIGEAVWKFSFISKPDAQQAEHEALRDAKINEITLDTLGVWPSFEAQSWACKVVHAVMAQQVQAGVQYAKTLDAPYAPLQVQADAQQDEREAFRLAWAEMEHKGYQYGRDALENVELGWNMARAAQQVQADAQGKQDAGAGD